MSETGVVSPAAEIAASAPKEAQPRADHGHFAPKQPEPEVNKGIREAQESTLSIAREAAREAFAGRRHPKEIDKKALDEVKPKAQGEAAKTDSDKAKATGTTSKDKPEPSSKEATRPAPKELDKARKALELEGWTEEDLADIPDEKIAALGKKAGEKHARIAREKREAAEAAKKGAQKDSGKEAGTTSDASEDAEADGIDQLAEETFAGFETTDPGSDPKAFTKAQAQFGRSLIEKGLAPLKAEFAEALKGLQSHWNGQRNLDRALDRVARDIPQVDEPDVREELTNRIAALAANPKTQAELKADIQAVIRRECKALELKDVKAEAEAQAREELRAAKEAGQPFTGHREAAPDKELTGMALIRQSIREAKAKTGGR